jgi:ribonucleotide monophosphatase NagD (HAD superfamily)
VCMYVCMYVYICICIGTPISLYKDGNADDTLLKTLQIAASRGIPAVCANLDLVAVVPSGIAHMPGVLKSLYEGISNCNSDI